MPYCGRYGCPCCTCKKCGQYNDCYCDLIEQTKAFLREHGEYRFDNERMEKAMDLLDEWQSKFPGT